MTTGWTDAAGRTGSPATGPQRIESGFADALCGPDGTADPAVLMPVLPVYPDALSAPMPDAMVAVPPVDPAALLAAARQTAPTPAQARVAAQRAVADRVAQPGRYGRSQASSAPTRPAQRPPAPSAWGQLEPRSAVAPHLQGPRQPGTNQSPRPPAPASGSSAWAGRTMSPAEVAGFLRSTFTGVARGANPTTQRYQPAPHAPTPALPRNPQRRRNRGSSIWAVLVFLVIIAFASGLAQQVINALGELFNR